MNFKKLFLTSLLTTFLLFGALGTSAQETQPPATGGDTAKGNNDLLASPKATTVAYYACTADENAGGKACPLSGGAATQIVASFADAPDPKFSYDLKQANAGRLPEILASLLSDTTIWRSEVSVAAVHIVDFRGNQPNATGATRDRWILATRDGMTKVRFNQGTRIMGQKKVAVVFLHLNFNKAADAPGGADQKPPDKDFRDITYRVLVEPKNSVNIDALIGVFRLGGGLQAQAAEKKPELVSYLGYGTLENAEPTSDVTFFGIKSGGPQLALVGSPIKYDNEGKHLWDVSIGVPANKISLLEYVEDDKKFQPKTINKQSVYGLVTISAPVDLKHGSLRYLIPRAAGGLGLTGRPGDSIFVGLVWGIPQVQFMVGSGFVANRVLRPGGDPANPADLIQRYTSRTTYGVTIPVLAALKKVTAKKN